MNRITLISSAALLLVSCTGTVPTATPAAHAPRSPAATTSHPAGSAMSRATAVEAVPAFAKRIRVTCTPQGRDLACIGGKPENGDIYDVELRPGCGVDGFFGGVVNDAGAELRDALPPTDRTTRAVLGAGQLVCIQAIGRVGQDPAYFYVSAVRAADVPQCRRNALCATYGDRTTRQWNLDSSTCRIASNGRPTDSCPQGWARREDIEDFSNGM